MLMSSFCVLEVADFFCFVNIFVLANEQLFIAISGNTQNVQTERWLCVCVFVREKDRERERPIYRERHRERKTGRERERGREEDRARERERKT
jgi:hypothetical protein